MNVALLSQLLILASSTFIFFTAANEVVKEGRKADCGIRPTRLQRYTSNVAMEV